MAQCNYTENGIYYRLNNNSSACSGANHSMHIMRIHYTTREERRVMTYDSHIVRPSCRRSVVITPAKFAVSWYPIYDCDIRTYWVVHRICCRNSSDPLAMSWHDAAVNFLSFEFCLRTWTYRDRHAGGQRARQRDGAAGLNIWSVTAGQCRLNDVVINYHQQRQQLSRS